MKGTRNKARAKEWVLVVLAILGMMACEASSQMAVEVRARLDTNVISVGESTVLRIYGQVKEEIEGEADRILTWYVDVFNGEGLVAEADYESMVKVMSDNDPVLGGTGKSEGYNRRGIRDTFLNLAGAGVSNEVELVAIPVTGVGEGQVTFSVGAGSGVTNLVEDFIVGRKGGGESYTGGDYGGASVELEVVGGGCALNVTIERGDGGGGPGGTLLLRFDPCEGYDHVVEYVDELETGAIWQEVGGGPHNSGQVTVTNTVARRFYRVRGDAR